MAVNRYGRVIKDPELPAKSTDSKPRTPALNVEVKRDKDGKEISTLAKKPEDKLVLEPGMIKLPDERVGLIMVFRVFERVSYALVMQASQPINKLDAVQTP